MHIEVEKCSFGGSSFADFPKDKCNFLHKNKLDTVAGSNSSQGGALRVVLPGQSSPLLPHGSRRLCCGIEKSMLQLARSAAIDVTFVTWSHQKPGEVREGLKIVLLILTTETNCLGKAFDRIAACHELHRQSTA